MNQRDADEIWEALQKQGFDEQAGIARCPHCGAFTWDGQRCSRYLCETDRLRARLADSEAREKALREALRGAEAWLRVTVELSAYTDKKQMLATLDGYRALLAQTTAGAEERGKA